MKELRRNAIVQCRSSIIWWEPRERAIRSNYNHIRRILKCSSKIVNTTAPVFSFLYDSIPSNSKSIHWEIYLFPQLRRKISERVDIYHSTKIKEHSFRSLDLIELKKI